MTWQVQYNNYSEPINTFVYDDFKGILVEAIENWLLNLQYDEYAAMTLPNRWGRAFNAYRRVWI